MKRVLIIDDDEFYAGLVAKVFGQRRWLPVVCHNMEDALKEINTLKVDLIVTDIFMPGIGGIKGIPFLNKEAPDIPVIAMTGGWDKMSPEETVKAAVKIGAKGGLAKPIKGELLDDLLKQLGLDGTDMGEPNWPQTVNETTDWDEVFDAPVNGLIEWISGADSFELMKISAINMLAHLFQNTRTELDARKYMERLQEILANGTSLNQGETLQAIISLLHEIKTKFKAEEARYVAEKRLERFEQRKSKRAAVPVPKPKPGFLEQYGVYLAGVTLVFGLGLGFILYGSKDVVEEEPKKKITQTEKKLLTRTPMGKTEVKKDDQPGPRQNPDELYRAPELKAKAWRPPSQKFEPPEETPPDMPPTLALAALEWATTSGRKNAVQYVPLVRLTEYEKMKIICDRAPMMQDLFNRALSSIPDDGNVPTADELSEAAKPLVKTLNERFDLTVVKQITFVGRGDMHHLQFINDACRPVTPKELRALGMDKIPLSEKFAKPAS